MVVLVTSKNEEDPIKNEGARVFTIIYINFSGLSRADSSGVGGGIRPKFNLIQAFMHVLVTCNYESDSIKNKGVRVVTTFFLF